jgi:hypothetical protein
MMEATMASEILCGPISFQVESRMVGDTGGPTVRVCDAQNGRELLRFDCFAKGAHWHADPPGKDVLTRLDPALDPLDWMLSELRSDLPAYLARAGFEPGQPLDPATCSAALAAVEKAARGS